MQTDLIYLAIVQMIISILLSIVIFFISYKMLIRVFKIKEEEINDSNLALSIFFSGIIFSIGYLLSGIIPSIISAVQLLKIHAGKDVYFQVLKYASLSLFIGFLLAIVINISAFLLVNVLTRNIKEVQELKNNNLAVAILLSAILISITIISRDSLVFLLELFLPQPTVIEYS